MMLGSQYGMLVFHSCAPVETSKATTQMYPRKEKVGTNEKLRDVSDPAGRNGTSELPTRSDSFSVPIVPSYT